MQENLKDLKDLKEYGEEDKIYGKRSTIQTKAVRYGE